MLIIFPNSKATEKSPPLNIGLNCRSISSQSRVTLSQQLVYEPITSYRSNLVQTLKLVEGRVPVKYMHVQGTECCT